MSRTCLLLADLALVWPGSACADNYEDNLLSIPKRVCRQGGELEEPTATEPALQKAAPAVSSQPEFSPTPVRLLPASPQPSPSDREETPSLAQAPPPAVELLDPPAEPNSGLPELSSADELGVNIMAPAGRMPRDFALERRTESPTPASEVLIRAWPHMAYHWKAPGSRHYPLYFQEVNAERYGYTCSHCLQPGISAAHFFGRIPALPYLMLAHCPRECVYTLGHYRPGNCNPWQPHWPPCAL